MSRALSAALLTELGLSVTRPGYFIELRDLAGVTNGDAAAMIDQVAGLVLAGMKAEA